MAEIEELKAARIRVNMKTAILESVNQKEHISKCKLADPEKYEN